MISKEFFSIAAIIICIIGYTPYIYGILKGTTRPHAFTWLIWFLIAAVVYTAQCRAGAGVGIWVTASIALICLIIFILTLRQGSKNITRSDCVSFTMGLLAIVLWHFTKEPFVAVVLSCIILLFGFYPTIRKSWHNPDQERIFPFGMATIRSTLNLFALSSFNPTTALYPVVNLLVSSAFVVFILWRRHKLELLVSI